MHQASFPYPKRRVGEPRKHAADRQRLWRLVRVRAVELAVQLVGSGWQA